VTGKRLLVDLDPTFVLAVALSRFNVRVAVGLLLVAEMGFESGNVGGSMFKVFVSVCGVEAAELYASPVGLVLAVSLSSP